MASPSPTDSERLLETFLELVRIDSPSREERALAEYCAAALAAEGCTVRYDSSDAVTGSDVGNLIAELPGTNGQVLVLSCHLDCVEPCRGVSPVIEDGVVRSAGETILGADDKAGLAAAIQTVRRVAEWTERPTVRCVFTVQEEIGLRGAKELAAQDVEGDVCLVLDAAGEPGGIVIAAPTHYTFDAVFLGKAAHAGVEPEKGVSAISMAASAISRMPLGRLDADTTANVGSIRGGSATNVITPEVQLTGECRSLDAEKVEQVRDSMNEAMLQAAEAAGGSVRVEWNLEYRGFSVGEDSDVYRMVSAACVELGIEPVAMRTGGGSDANIISALGVPTLALSSGMSGVHGVGEHIAVRDIEALADICTAVARQLT